MRTLIKCGALAAALFAFASAPAADVKENWDKNCAKCHGADGKGQTKMGRQSGAKDYTDPKVQAEFDDAKGALVIKEGVKEGAKEKMKGFGDKLSDEEIKALVGYVRAFKK
jgi:mono/diheme cytochrome c family protein